MATTLDSGLDLTGGIALDATAVYYTVGGTGVMPGAITKVTK
jgi:hypothetical protein